MSKSSTPMRTLFLIFAFSFALPVAADTGMSQDPDATYYRHLWAGHYYCYPRCLLPPRAVNPAIIRNFRDGNPEKWDRLIERARIEYPELHRKLLLIAAPDP